MSDQRKRKFVNGLELLQDSMGVTVTDYSDFDPATFDPKSMVIIEPAVLLGPTLELAVDLPRNADEPEIDAIFAQFLAAASAADPELGFVHDSHRTRLQGDRLIVVLHSSIPCTLARVQTAADRVNALLAPGMAAQPRVAA